MSALGPLAVHILGFSLACIRDCSPTRVWWFPMTLGVVALLVFFPILVSTVVGLRHLDQEVLEAAELDGASGWTMAAAREFPLAAPTHTSLGP